VRTAGFVIGGVGIASLIASGTIFYLRHTAIGLTNSGGPNRMSCPDSSRSPRFAASSIRPSATSRYIAGALGLVLGARS